MSKQTEEKVYEIIINDEDFTKCDDDERQFYEDCLEMKFYDEGIVVPISYENQENQTVGSHQLP